MDRSEKQNEGEQMERDLVVAPELWPIELERTSDARLFSNAINVYGKTKGFATIQVSTLVEATTCFGGAIDLTFFSTTVKDEHANLVVETNVEGATLILVQLKTIVVPTTIVLSPSTAMEELGIDVKVEVMKATIMEE